MPGSAEPARTEPARTAWGDAEGRRRDILASAERLLAESGYAALTVRAVAAGAGVSPGTVYQYFDGKEDVFAALMTRRLAEIRDTLEAADRTKGVAALLRSVLPHITELWRHFGRSTPQWEATVLGEDGAGTGVTASLTEYRRIIRALAEALEEAAATTGVRPSGDPAMPHWVWDCLIGLADDLLHQASRLNRVPADRLTDFAVAAIERGITAAPSGDDPGQP